MKISKKIIDFFTKYHDKTQSQCSNFLLRHLSREKALLLVTPLQNYLKTISEQSLTDLNSRFPYLTPIEKVHALYSIARRDGNNSKKFIKEKLAEINIAPCDYTTINLGVFHGPENEPFITINHTDYYDLSNTYQM